MRRPAMPNSRRPLLTHFGALLIGAILGSNGVVEPPVGPPDFRASGDSETPSDVRSGKRSPSGSTKHGRNKQTWGSAAYAAAWEQLQEHPAPLSEQYLLGESLLQGWASVDLEAALRADLSVGGRASSFPFVETPLEISFDLTETNLDELWDLIKKRAFGIETIVVRKAWTCEMARREPMRLLGMLDDLPSTTREPAIKQALYFGLKETRKHRQGIQYLVSTAMARNDDAFTKLIISCLSEVSSDQAVADELKVEQDPAKRLLLMEALTTTVRSGFVYRGDFSARLGRIDKLSVELRAEIEAFRKEQEDNQD